MSQYNNHSTNPRGFSSLLVLIILAVISTTIIAIAVVKTNRQVNTLVTQLANIELDSMVTAALYEQAIDYIATGNAINQQLNIGSSVVTVTTTTSTFKKNEKELTGVNISVTNTTPQTAVLDRQVVLQQMQRLERFPLSALTLFTSEQIDSITSYYFNLNALDFKALKTRASYNSIDCLNVSSAQLGLIWISGTCDLQSINLGNQLRPVFIVIENGNLTLDDTYIYGLVLHLCDASKAHNSQISHNSYVFGAFISSCEQPANLGSLVYEEILLNTLVDHRDNVSTEFVEGSWRSQ